MKSNLESNKHWTIKHYKAAMQIQMYTQFDI